MTDISYLKQSFSSQDLKFRMSVRKQLNEFSFQSISRPKVISGPTFPPSSGEIRSRSGSARSGLDHEQWICVFLPAANQIRTHSSPHLHSVCLSRTPAVKGLHNYPWGSGPEHSLSAFLPYGNNENKSDSCTFLLKLKQIKLHFFGFSSLIFHII